MSVTIDEVTYHSKGVRLLTEIARQTANLSKTKIKDQLETGGATADEAEKVASSCQLSTVGHHFDLIKNVTIQVRMTQGEFETVRAALGM